MIYSFLRLPLLCQKPQKYRDKKATLKIRKQIKHREKITMNKYTIRTETETIYTDKVEVLEKNNFNISYVFVRENHILYRILNGDETELQPDALLLCNEDGTEKQMCQYAHFNTAQEAFDCVNYNTKRLRF